MSKDREQELDLEIAAREWARRANSTLIGQFWDASDETDLVDFGEWFVKAMKEILTLADRQVIFELRSWDQEEPIEFIFTPEMVEEEETSGE